MLQVKLVLLQVPRSVQEAGLLVVRLVPQVRFFLSLWVPTLSAKPLSKWMRAKKSVLTAQKPTLLPQVKPH
jgi:hypothetical protein